MFRLAAFRSGSISDDGSPRPCTRPRQLCVLTRSAPPPPCGPAESRAHGKTLSGLCRTSAALRLFSPGKPNTEVNIANSSPSRKGAPTYDLRHSGGDSPALLTVGLVQQVWRERVKFSQLVKSVVPLDLLLVHHSVGQRLLGHLPVIDLFLHGALQMENDRNGKSSRSVEDLFSLTLSTAQGAVSLPELGGDR